MFADKLGRAVYAKWWRKEVLTKLNVQQARCAERKRCEVKW